jgi:hypothetical protein
MARMARRTVRKTKARTSGPKARTGTSRRPARSPRHDRYSPTTRRAKWIHSLDEHADRPGQSLATRSPEVIKRWAEERHAVPATVRGSGDGGIRSLRFDFGSPEDRLAPVLWDEWLETFRRRELVFLFQERLKNGRQSNFFRLDHHEGARIES